MPFDFNSTQYNEWEFKDCFTIDPSKGAEAWAKLSLNQMGLELGMLPATLHEALLATLSERRPFTRKLRDQ